MMLRQFSHLISRMQTTTALVAICIATVALCSGCGEPICKRKLTCVDDSGVGGSGGGQGSGVGGSGGDAGQGGIGGTPEITPQMERLSAGIAKSCLIMSGEIYCVGSSLNGGLGNGDASEQIYSTASKVSNITGAVAVSHNCALLDDGSMQCWGNNSYGQLGQGDFVDQPIPQVVPIDNVIKIRGGATVCALRVNGTLWCWGANNSGEVGVYGLLGDVWMPVQTEISEVVDIYEGYGRNYAKRGNGELWSWPVSQGQPPIKVDVFFNPVALGADSGGSNPACAVTADDGFVYCWGENDYGQLGNGTNTFSAEAVTAQISDAVSIAVGKDFRCALSTTGSVSCWGRNDIGQLGNGTNANATTPQPVGIGPAIAVSAGPSHACALLVDETVWCWGDNQYGQLGNSSTENSNVPVAVQGLPGSG